MHLKDGSRSSGRRAFQHSLSAQTDTFKISHTAAIISLDKITADHSGVSSRINGYSNGYGSASDMEINDDQPEELDDSSDDIDYSNFDDLPPLPSPQKVN